MRGPSLLLLAVGLGCSFETGSAPNGSGELEQTGTETTEGTTTSVSTSAVTSSSGDSTGTPVATEPALTTSGEVGDTQEPTAFSQLLVVLRPDDYDFAEVPLLVTLTPENTQWDAIEPDVSNLRFVGRDNRRELELPFEVAGIADESVQLWVLLPEVSPNADRFRVEYGVGVRPQPWSPGDVWSGYEAVWHLGEDPANAEPQYRDASGNEHHITNPMNDAIPSDEMVRGIVGRAPRFAEGRELQISNSDWPGSNIGARFTVEAWVQYEREPPSSYRTIVRKVGAYDLVGSRAQGDPLERPSWAVNDGLEFHSTTASGQSWNQGPGVWNYVAATFERDDSTSQVHTLLYLDGVEAAMTESLAYDPAQNAADFRIGSNLSAVVDEVRVSSEVRPPRWFELQDRSMRDELLEYGEPEPR